MSRHLCNLERRGGCEMDVSFRFCGLPLFPLRLLSLSLSLDRLCVLASQAAMSRERKGKQWDFIQMVLNGSLSI